MKLATRDWFVASMVLLISFGVYAPAANAQGPPDVEWMAGGHSSQVHSVAVSPDGQMLASGSGDTTIKRWKVSDGSRIR